MIVISIDVQGDAALPETQAAIQTFRSAAKRPQLTCCFDPALKPLPDRSHLLQLPSCPKLQINAPA
jgi:hypothetical protein